MLEACRRLSGHDFVLAVLSTTILVFFCCSDQGPRQTIKFSDSEGGKFSAALVVGSPAWRDAVDRQKRWLNSGFEEESATHAWRLELANHYAQAAADRMTTGSLANAAKASYASGWSLTQSSQHWGGFADRVKLDQLNMQKRISARLLGEGGAPVVLGSISKAGKPRGAFALSVASGLGVGILFWVTAWLWPVMKFAKIEQGGDASVSPPDKMAGSGSRRIGQSYESFSVEIPERWIAIRQTLPVHLRQFTLFGLVVAAVSCVVLISS